jgi:hypothetical protein
MDVTLLADFDLWDTATGNRIIETQNQGLVRAIVRELISQGEAAEDLSLWVPVEHRFLSGPELAAWLEGGEYG